MTNILFKDSGFVGISWNNVEMPVCKQLAIARNKTYSVKALEYGLKPC